MKKLVVSCWLLVVSVAMATGAQAAETVTSDITPGANALPSAGSRVKVDYVRQGVQKDAQAYPVTPSGTSSELLLSNDWYVAQGKVTVGKTRVRGEVHLILEDGAELTVNGGIQVEGDDKLHIYGQGGGNGKLVANGSYDGAGIGGGGEHCGCGTVTIYGGVVTATGESTGEFFGAGIGGGVFGAGGTVTINGGTVTAIGGGNGGAGIGGGGRAGKSGTVTINGGTVTAIGGMDAAGIGGGANAAGGTVTINGGTVTAKGDWYGAGIGGGGAGGGSVKITGGTVVADGFTGLDGTVTIDGGSIKAKSIESLPKNSAGQRLHKVTVKCEGIGEQGSAIGLEGLGGYGTKDIYSSDGYIYLYLPDGTYHLQATPASQTKKAVFAVMGDDANIVLGETGRLFVNGECIDNGEGDGWWVNGQGDCCLTLTNSMRYVLSGAADALCVEVLADGATVVLSNATICAPGVGGRLSALFVGNGKAVDLQMSGQTSCLFATNGVPAIELGADYDDYPSYREGAQLKVALAEGADRFAEIIVVNYGTKPAIAGKSSSSVEVESGSFLVKSDERASKGTFGISKTPTCPLLMKTGPTPDEVRFADAYNGEAFVGVVPSCKITVPPHEGVGSVVVSNDIEQLRHVGGGVYRAMQTEEVTIDFILSEGYEIVRGGRITIPCLTNDVTVGCEEYPWPDIRRKLTVTLPESLEGETYVVTEGGKGVKDEGEGEGEGTRVYPVRSGYDVEIICTAQESWRIVSPTNVVTFANIQESKVLTAADLPQALRLFTVTIPKVEGVYPTLTSTDGRMIETDDDAYGILSNAEVTVTFFPLENYRITANGTKAWTLTGDVTFGETEDFPLPTVEGIPGTDVAPWIVGKDVSAYTNAEGVLTITGTGAMDDFANAESVPWDPASVKELAIGEGVTKIGANAWAGLSGDIVVDGGLPLSRYALVGGGFAVPAAPSGAVSAGFDAVQITGGKAYLGVSVKTNSEVKVRGEGEGWGKVNVRPGDVSVRDGSVIIAVPANAEKGFMVLESGDAGK